MEKIIMLILISLLSVSVYGRKNSENELGHQSSHFSPLINSSYDPGLDCISVPIEDCKATLRNSLLPRINKLSLSTSLKKSFFQNCHIAEINMEACLSLLEKSLSEASEARADLNDRYAFANSRAQRAAIRRLGDIATDTDRRTSSVDVSNTNRAKGVLRTYSSASIN